MENMEMKEYLAKDVEAMQKNLQAVLDGIARLEGQRGEIDKEIDRLRAVADQQKGALSYSQSLLQGLQASENTKGEGIIPDEGQKTPTASPGTPGRKTRAQRRREKKATQKSADGVAKSNTNEVQ